jgi:beta-galactosidase
MQTTGSPAQLALAADRKNLRADAQDLSFVVVELVDATGRRCFAADHEVEFTLSGPGTIAAIGSGDLSTTASYQANPRRVFQGRALVVVRTTQEAGEITLTATVQGLDHAQIILRSR